MPPSPPCDYLGCPALAAYRLATARDAAAACRDHLEEGVRQLVADSGAAVTVWPVLAGELDDRTRPFPPITETVRRRPPVPAHPPITELSGAELVRALYDELGTELRELQQQEPACPQCGRRDLLLDPDHGDLCTDCVEGLR